MDKYLELYISHLPKIKTRIHWWNLYQGHYIFLEKSFQKQIIDLALEKTSKQFTSLSNKINVSRRTLAECYKLKRNLKISSLIKIMKFINMDLTKAENKILNIGKGKFKPKLPFELNNEYGAEIRAAFLSDGHNPKNPTHQPMYCALELELHERLIYLCKKIFGKFETKSKFNNKSYITRFPAPINSALYLAGVPRGDKRLVNCFVPRDIFRGTAKLQKSYLRRIFDDEGDVCLDKSGKRAVRLTRSFDVTKYNFNIRTHGKWLPGKNIPTNTLIFGEFILLKKFGINAKLYPEGFYKSKNSRITAKWRIQIAQQDELKKFQKLINFNLKRKKSKLSDVLDSYVVKEFPNYEGEKFVLSVINKISKNKGHVTFGDVGKELEKIGRTHDLAGHYIKILTRKCKIKKIRRGAYIVNN